MSSNTEKRGRGRPRNPVTVVSFNLSGTPRDSKQLQVKANKLGGKVITRSEKAMVVHFTRKGAGSAAVNFERSVLKSQVASGITRSAVDPYSL